MHFIFQLVYGLIDPGAGAHPWWVAPGPGLAWGPGGPRAAGLLVGWAVFQLTAWPGTSQDWCRWIVSKARSRD